MNKKLAIIFAAAIVAANSTPTQCGWGDTVASWFDGAGSAISSGWSATSDFCAPAISKAEGLFNTATETVQDNPEAATCGLLASVSFNAAMAPGLARVSSRNAKNVKIEEERLDLLSYVMHLADKYKKFDQPLSQPALSKEFFKEHYSRDPDLRLRSSINVEEKIDKLEKILDKHEEFEAQKMIRLEDARDHYRSRLNSEVILNYHLKDKSEKRSDKIFTALGKQRSDEFNSSEALDELIERATIK